MSRRLKLLACLTALLCLCSCSLVDSLPAALKPTGETVPAANLPDLRQLVMPAPDQNPWQSDDAAVQASTLQLDLWLDASQVAGGINPAADSLYPHRSNRYREGGFHYRYDSQTGWYENILRNLLACAEGSRVRILRSGNEHLTDAMLVEAGLTTDQSPEAIRSLRRDLLTYAIDPMPSVLTGFSGESMAGSFYSLFSPQMNRMPALLADGKQPLLENPALLQPMSDWLDALIAAYDPEEDADVLDGLLTDDFSPLMQALHNLDPNRLSIITCDPLTLRRLSGTTATGEPLPYLQQLLDSTGLFEKGLAVELYAFRLDYMGQIHTINAADLSQPFIWGRLDYNQNRGEIKSAMPMPRTLLMLVVGKPAQVDAYTTALNTSLRRDPALKGLRGPDKGQLTYSIGGETLTQQPFTFGWEQTRIQRHGVDAYTGSTCQVALTKGQGSVTAQGPHPTIALAGDQQGQCEVTVTWPVSSLDGGMQLDTSRLSALQVEGTASLLLTDTQPNMPGYVAPEGVQTLTLRDTLYLFTYTEDTGALPFVPKPLTISEDGQTLEATFTCDAADLKPGYYRMVLRADISGSQLSWPQEPWIDRLNAPITNEQIVSWQHMADMLTEHSRYSENVPSQFWHAWGDTSGKTYRDAIIPDCPPVYAAPRLTELFTQLRNAATFDSLPFVYLPLDVFVAPQNQLPASQEG